MWVFVYNIMIFYKLGDLSLWLVFYLIGVGIIGVIIFFLGWFLIFLFVGIVVCVFDLIVVWCVGLKF